MNRILILLAMLVVGNVYALPPCPSGVWHNCFGTKTFANGAEYVGEWKGGKMHGHGTITWADGGNYVGDWKDGRFHKGTKTWADGSN